MKKLREKFFEVSATSEPFVTEIGLKESREGLHRQ
jgi:hypothetical protein